MILVGDCLEVMRTLDANSVDAIVTDPPYGLGFMGKAWDDPSRMGDIAMRRNPAMDAVNTGVAKQGGRQRACADFQKRAAREGRQFSEWVEAWATEAMRVAKPGAFMAAFGGTRMHHRLMTGIEDAGWEIRDVVMYVYGSGFPKSHNLDRKRGKVFCDCEATESTAEREVRAMRDTDVPPPFDAIEGGGQVLLPCVSQQGTPATGRTELPSAEARPKQSSVEGWSDDQAAEGKLQGRPVCQGAGVGEADGAGGRLHHGTPAGHGADLWVPADANGSGRSLGPQPIEQSPIEPAAVSDECGSQAGGAWPLCAGCGKPRIPYGLGTALKPAWEPIILARKPLNGTVAANVLAHGTGALNIDGCRVLVDGEDRAPITGRGGIPARNNEDDSRGPGIVAQPHALGRWPANLIHDGSAEVLAAFPSAPGQQGDINGDEPSRPGKNTYGEYGPRKEFKARRDGEASAERRYTEEGGTNFAPLPGMRREPEASAARFFYCAKADRADRNDGCDEIEARKVHGPSGDGRCWDIPGSKSQPRANNHPTVKPTDLMRWLCRLCTPTGGLVLDPFCGSGSTGRGAIAEGFRFVGIEMDPDYAAIAEARIRAVQPGLPLGAAA